MDIFERLESRVRSYIRSFPVVFDTAQGPYQTDTTGRRYIDFFCGAGALNYGHNEPGMKRALLDYISADGVMHSLDMATRAKAAFLERFEQIILKPRGLDYRVQFTGPTGTNAVEAAMKLARKVTGRSQVIAFTQAYHGLSAGALAASANAYYREPHYVQRGNVTFMPYDGYFGPSVDTTEYLAKLLDDESSGLDRPAAIIVETIQAEGGINVASAEWLRKLQTICHRRDILLIVDDIQTGCGRTGTFFSFEPSGIVPDIVTLSKSISGYGFPMSLVLLKPGIDQWKPGEHTGTFRGNNVAFVTAAAALGFWTQPEFTAGIAHTHTLITSELTKIGAEHSQLQLKVRGRGLLLGVETNDPEINRRIARECFTQGLIVETCGGSRNVIKLMPPLNVPADVAQAAMKIVASSVVSAASLASA